MAIITPGAALRQINRLFTGGTVTGLSDAQLLERFVAGGERGGVRGIGGAAWVDGSLNGSRPHPSRRIENRPDNAIQPADNDGLRGAKRHYVRQ
jgi:hypothetical protein